MALFVTSQLPFLSVGSTCISGYCCYCLQPRVCRNQCQRRCGKLLLVQASQQRPVIDLVLLEERLAPRSHPVGTPLEQGTRTDTGSICAVMPLDARVKPDVLGGNTMAADSDVLCIRHGRQPALMSGSIGGSLSSAAQHGNARPCISSFCKRLEANGST